MAGNPIEYSVICIDNSDYMRNEDIRPNRFFAEKDAANIICHHILSSRPENRVAIVKLANSPQVIQSLTNNEIHVMRKLYAIEMKGEIDLMVSIKISILAIKQISLKGLVTANKRQRIVVFVGSPFKEDQKQLESLVSKLNKLKISVDIISFGLENENKTQILQSFVRKLKDSNLVNVANNRVMTNVLAESPILSNSRAVALVNENMDPELALAMKLSVDEHRNQFDEDVKKATEESAQTSKESAGSPSSKSDGDIQKAIDLSLNFMNENNIPTNGSKSQKTQLKTQPKTQSKTQPKTRSKTQPKTQPKTNTEFKGLTDEEQLALTLQMSLFESQKHSKDASNVKKEPKKANNTKSKINRQKNQKK